MSKSVIVHPESLMDMIGSSGIILIGGLAILVLFMTYGFTELGLSLEKKLKSDKTLSLNTAKLKIALPALFISVLPTLLAIAYIRAKLFDFNGDLFASSWIVLGTLTIGFLIQATLMIIFFRRYEQADTERKAQEPQTSSSASAEKAENNTIER